MTVEFFEEDRGFFSATKWKGKKADAVKAALEGLDDVEYCPVQKSWVLRDYKTGLELPLTKDDLAVAGAAILSGSKTWYPYWRRSVLYDLLHSKRWLRLFRWVL